MSESPLTSTHVLDLPTRKVVVRVTDHATWVDVMLNSDQIGDLGDWPEIQPWLTKIFETAIARTVPLRLNQPGRSYYFWVLPNGMTITVQGIVEGTA